MAPIDHASTAQAESAIRETIQSLYNVMLHTANYDATGPHTTLDALVREVGVLSSALRSVSVAGDASSSSSPSTTSLPSVPQDLVQYVEAGRNPDIYTREFVELVRKTNQIRAGKQASFAQFQAVLARQTRSALPELSGDVDRILAATGGVANAAQAKATAAADAAADAAAVQPPPPPPATATQAPGPARSNSASSRDGTPGVLTPGGSTPGPNAAAPAAGGVAAVDMMGILPLTPQGAAVPANQDTHMT